MEVVFHSPSVSKPCFYAGGVSLDSFAGARSFSGGLLRSSSKPMSKVFSPLISQFRDSAHMEYYAAASTIRCCDGVFGETKKTKKKDKVISDAATLKKLKKKEKKKAKLLKDLSNDLTVFSGMGLGLDSDHGLVDATELLLAQLQKLKAEEKELKRKKKLEKAKLKATARMQISSNSISSRVDCDASSSSSSSSESSDSECGELVDMRSLKCRSPQPQTQPQPQPQAVLINDIDIPGNSKGAVTLEVEGNTIELQSVNPPDASNRSSLSMVEEVENTLTMPMKKIEVCMGGKCKKAGAAALLDEFQRVVGVEGACVGCKCMGKCRDGPNVRVLLDQNHNHEAANDKQIRSSSSSSSNSLCVGVGIEDVGLIVSNFIAGEALATASAAAAADLAGEALATASAADLGIPVAS